MKLSFLILTWNRYKFLEICLERLLASLAAPDGREAADCEIIILDNGSTDATPAILARYRNHPNIRILTLPKHQGLNAYKKLFAQARGDLMVTLDDDVLELPPALDRIFLTYMHAFPDFGYLALNVIQDERTNGAKPGPELYTEDLRGPLAVQLGPTGGWCACFRRRDYRKIRLTLYLRKFSMRHSEDAVLIARFKRLLGLKSGIIRDAVCLHACGPFYAKLYGHLDREIAKYAASGLTDFVDHFSTYLPSEPASTTDEPQP